MSLLTNRLVRGDQNRERFFHTSGYARGTHGVNIGSAAGTSFAERQALEDNRRYIKRYNNQRAVNDGNALSRVSGMVMPAGHLTESTRERLVRQAQERLFSGHDGFQDTNGDGFGGAHSVLLPQ